MEKTLAMMCYRILSSILFFLQPLLNLFFARGNTSLSPQKLKQHHSCTTVQYRDKEDHEKLNQTDIKIIMDRLEMVCRHEDGFGGDERFGADELLSLFEEEDPCSLEEVKEAFNMFDENKDGFIDARELNIVMCRLGLKEGTEVEECARMIQAVAEDGKEKIDFDDFVRFMEGCYY